MKYLYFVLYPGSVYSVSVCIVHLFINSIAKILFYTSGDDYRMEFLPELIFRIWLLIGIIVFIKSKIHFNKLYERKKTNF